jgi:hypothetical protein
MNKTNVVPFDSPLDGLNQKQLRFLRTMADRRGLTIAQVVDRAAELLLAREVARDAKKNVIPFPVAD